MKAFRHFVHWLAHVGIALAAIALLASMGLIVYSVVMRYGFNQPITWVDELVGYLLVACVMLAAADALREGEHIAVDIVTERLSARGKRLTAVLGLLAVAASALLLVIEGWDMVAFSRMVGLLSNGYMAVPMWIPQALVPIGAAGLVLVLLTGIPVFAGLLLFATAIVVAVEGKLGGIGDLVFGKLDTYLLVSIPLFTLMAHFMIRGKVVDDLFGAANTLLRFLPGGMGVATVAACTMFAAISGSSVATALTIGSAAIPLMIRAGYSPRVAYGVVGGGGTLGILIPPSGPMILYGVVSDTSIGALFVAGIVPGLMLAVIFVIYSMVSARYSSHQVKTQPRASGREIVTALRRSFWALTLPVLAALGINPIWYGILLTINLELALITPPVGMNHFAIKAISRAPIREIIIGVAPYVGLLLFGLALVLMFPQIALWLPGTMNYK